MSRLPRILPLVAVALGGVLAINLLAGAGALPQMFHGAQAWAEDIAAPKTKAKPKAAAGGAAPTTVATAAPTQSPVPPMPVANALPGIPANAAALCAPNETQLAAQAGMSPAELQLLQSLKTKDGQIDAREQGIDSQMQLLAAAEQKVDGKIVTMQDLITQMKALLGQADQQEEADNKRLVTTYEGMDPKKAAPQLAIMKDEVRLPILANMNVRKLSAILAAMPAPQAQEITEKLAKRTTDAFALDQARAAVAAAGTTTPTQTASAAPATAAKAPAPTTTPAKAATPAPTAAKAGAPGRGGTPAATPAPGRGGAAPTAPVAATTPAKSG